MSDFLLSKNTFLINQFQQDMEEYLKIINEYSTDKTDDQSAILETAKSILTTSKNMQSQLSAIEKATDADLRLPTLEETSNFPQYAKEVYEKVAAELANDHDDDCETDPIYVQLKNSTRNIHEDETDEEDVAEVSSQMIKKEYRDPISKKPIKKACKNSVCNHIYDYDVVMGYLRKKKGKGICPYVGCLNNNMLASQIVLDAETQRKVDDSILNDISTVDLD